MQASWRTTICAIRFVPPLRRAGCWRRRRWEADMTTPFNLLRNVRSQVGHAMDQRAKLLSTSAQLTAQVAAAESDAAAAIAAGNQQKAAAALQRAAKAREKRGSTLGRLDEV